MYKAKYIEKDNQLYLQLTSKNGKKQLLPITEERATLLINDEGELKRDNELSDALNDPRFFPAPVESNEIEEVLDRYLANKNKADNWSNILKEMNLTPLKQIFKTDRDKRIDDILNNPKTADEEKIRIKKAIEIMNNLGIGADGDDKMKDLEENMDNSLKKIEKLTTRLNQYEDKTIAEVIEEEDDKVIKNLYKLANTINKKVDGNTKIIDILQIANNTANELKDIIGISDDDDVEELEDENNTYNDSDDNDVKILEKRVKNLSSTQAEKLENMEKQLEYIKNLLTSQTQNNSTNSSRVEKMDNEESEDEIDKKKEELEEILKPRNEFLTTFNRVYNTSLNDVDKNVIEKFKQIAIAEKKEYNEDDYRLNRMIQQINLAGGPNKKEITRSQFDYFSNFVTNNKPFITWEEVKEENRGRFFDNKQTYNSRLNKFKHALTVLSDNKLNQDLFFQPEIPKRIEPPINDEKTPSTSAESPKSGTGLKRLLAKYTKKK